MEIETESDRLNLLEDEAEDFDTGHAETLRAVFRRTRYDVLLDDQVVANYKTELYGRASDFAAHDFRLMYELVRAADGSVFFVKGSEPDGTGMTVIELKQ